MPESFSEYEHTGWQNVAGGYEKYLGSLTSQSIHALLEAANVEPNCALLDIASGPGYVASAAAQRGAKVIGIDFSANMVALSQRRLPQINFEIGNAEHLQFEDCSFDALTMNFGILHLEHPELAVQEAYRVLRSGGKFAFSCWDLPEKSVGFRIVLQAINEFADREIKLPEGPAFFRFSDASESNRIMRNAGFDSIEISAIKMIWRFQNACDVFHAFVEGTPRTGGIIRAQTTSVQELISRSVERSAEAYRVSENLLEIPMQSLIISGVK